MTATSVATDAITGGGGTGAGNPISITSSQPNSSVSDGVKLGSSMTRTGGNLVTVYNAAALKAAVDFQGYGQFYGLKLTSTFSGEGIQFPNANIYEAGNQVMFTQLSGKTINRWIFAQPVRFDGNVGFYATTPIAKPAVTGSRGANAALASLLTQLAALGLITDSSTA